ATSYNFQVGAGGPGSGDFSAPNPPYGVPFTLWTGPDAGGAGELAVVIREDGSGRELDRVPLGEDAGGLQRVVWDLTEAPPEDTGRGGRGGGGGGRGGGGRGRGRSGPPVRSGFFEAAVVRAPEGGADTVLTEWRTFRVLPLEVEGR
ncbi:MAG TPA: hypothetical protein VE173_08240, partial [Longimicrobiales bacterium]|nr:hypothetical protein [Longimicrobiales bacterium]